MHLIMKIIGSVDNNTAIVSVDIAELAKIAGLTTREFKARGPLANGDVIAVSAQWDELQVIRVNLAAANTLVAELSEAADGLELALAALPIA